jgi:uncharacterized membrane protein
MIVRPVEVDGRTDRQRDMAKLIVAFRNFENMSTASVILDC